MDTESPDQLRKRKNTENYFLEKEFIPPIALVTYQGVVSIKTSVKVKRYDLKIDDAKEIKKLGVLFAFQRSSYDAIRSGIKVNKEIEAQHLKPIKPRKKRPKVASREEYDAGWLKDVRVVMRNGHVLYGTLYYTAPYNLMLNINNHFVLVYKHGIQAFQIENDTAKNGKQS